jgi:GTPase SAR1 family protein
MTDILKPENNPAMNMEEALQYLKGTRQATSITSVDRLKVAVVGPGKVGKSTLIAKTCRKPLLEYDFDDRAESIAGLPDVTIKTLIDKASAFPSAWSEFESDIGTLEWLKKDGKLPFKSIALDSMSYLRQYAENQMMKDTNNQRMFKINSTVYHIGAGWDAVTCVQKMLYEAIRRLFALDIDVYCVFHTAPEKDKAKSTKENTVYTERMTVDPNNLQILLPIFNEVWRAYVNADGGFRIQLKPDYYFQAASALKVDQIEDQDIQKLLDKHNGTK